MFQAFVQVAVLDEVDSAHLRIHAAARRRYFQDGQLLVALVSRPHIVVHLLTCKRIGP